MLRDGRFSAEGEVVEVPESWTPEHSVLAGLLDCSLTSLRYHALRLGVAVHAEGSARGEITKRDDGRYGFVSIEVRFDVAPRPEARRRRDRRPVRQGGAGLLRGRLAETGALVHLERRMRLLLLGGAKFVGRALIEAALERGHAVTTFNRGQTNRGAFPEVEELHGDRDGNLEALRGRSWDAVLDTSAYVPQFVRSAAEVLAGSVERYAFVSSISVYADYSQPIPEDAPLEAARRRSSRRRAAARLRELRPAEGPLRAGARGAFRGAGADRPARPDRRAE